MGIMGLSSNVWGTVAVLVMIAGLVPMLSIAVDPDPLQDFCVADPNTGVFVNGFPCKPAAKVTAWDFWSAALKNPGDTNNANMAYVTPAFVDQFPGLNTLGIGAARVDYAKGDLNPPHTHPRATEILLVVKCELYVGFVGTLNILWATIVTEGEMFVFPCGLIHLQLNVGNSPALAFAAFNSQNPGAKVIAPALFMSGHLRPDIKDEVLEKGFSIDQETVDMIQEKFRI